DSAGSTADGSNPYAAAREVRSRIERAHTSLDLSGSFEGYITDPIRLAVGDSTLSRMSNAEAMGWSLGISVAIYSGGAALAPLAPQSATALAWSLGGRSLVGYTSVQAGLGALETGVEWAGTRLFGSASDRANFSFLGSFAKNTAINFVTGGFAKIGFAGRQGLEILGDTAYDVGVGGQSFGSSLAMNTVGSLGGELVGWGLQTGAKQIARQINLTNSLGYARRIASQTQVELLPYRSRAQFNGIGEAHHLNQSGILGQSVTFADGMTTPLVGDAFGDIGSPHFMVHRGLEAFFDMFRLASSVRARYARPDGLLLGQRPTFSQYNRALYNSLLDSGIDATKALRMVQAAKSEQFSAGFRGADLLPFIPRRMGQRGGL
ncbi:MAG: hypothetical protein JNM18_13685, partial [Planctomycetaceae bacterium]|nr:hypothetical protein [Planctomycetaceae bacterium]